MSVLLIGLNSDTFTYGFSRRKTKSTKWNRLNHKKQDDYRKELDLQVEQKQLRLQRQKQFQKWTDIKLQAKYNREIWRLRHQQQAQQQERRGEFVQGYRRYQSLANQSKVHLSRNDEKKSHQVIQLPPVYNYSTTYLNSYGTITQPNHSQPIPIYSHKNQSTPHRHSRVKTDGQIISHRSNRYKTQGKGNNYMTYQYQNPELGLKQLKRYEDLKINEVYQMLNDSVKILNVSTNQINLQSSSSKKRLQYRPMSHYQNEHNVTEEYYHLPSQSKIIRLEDHEDSLKEKQWRAWYAKQKLQELHSYFKKEQIHDEIQHQILDKDRPLYTLGFSSKT